MLAEHVAGELLAVPHRVTAPMSYQDHTHWQNYQRFFPPALRCEGSALPEESYWPWRGLSVHLDHYPAAHAPVKLIVVHGAGGYGRMLAACGLAARAGGAEVVAPDLPGYGLTAAPSGYDYPDWIDCLSDLVRAEGARDERPVVLLGASMGGMLAYAAAARGGVAGLVATCLLDPRDVAVRRAVARVPWLGAAGVPLLAGLARVAGGVRVPIRWLANMNAMSSSRELNRIVCGDPQGGGNRVPLGFLASYLASTPEVEPESFTACPVLLAHPAEDTWTPPSVSLPFFERLACPKRYVLLEAAGHFPVEEPGISQLRAEVSRFLAEVAGG